MLAKKESQIPGADLATLLPEPDYNLVEDNHSPYVTVIDVNLEAISENDRRLIRRGVKLKIVTYHERSIDYIFNRFSIDENNHRWRFQGNIYAISNLTTPRISRRYKDNKKVYDDIRYDLITLYMYVLMTLKIDSTQFSELLPEDYKDQLDIVESYLYSDGLEEVGITFLFQFMDNIHKIKKPFEVLI